MIHDPGKKNEEERTMTRKMNNTEKLQAERERILREKHKLEARERAIRKKIADEDRKAKTHRLYTRGGMLESFLPDPENITDDAVINLLKEIFNLPAVKKLAASISERPSVSNEPVDFIANKNSEMPEEPFELYEEDEPDEEA